MANKIVQLQDSAGDNIFPVTDPEITMTDTDPGEGATLAAGKYTAVYGASTILDMFYPVGSYYETSNTSFDPNVSWGGTWVEDTAGRVLVARDASTFSTVGDTGGAESHTHSDGTLCAGVETFGTGGRWYFDFAWKGSGVSWTQTGRIYTGDSYQEPSFSEPGNGGIGVYGNTGSSSSLQPYIVVKRWHRTA